MSAEESATSEPVEPSQGTEETAAADQESSSRRLEFAVAGTILLVLICIIALALVALMPEGPDTAVTDKDTSSGSHDAKPAKNASTTQTAPSSGKAPSLKITLASSQKLSTTAPPIAKQVCDTEDCQFIRSLIVASLDKSRDPCHNFYEYVCSSIQNSYPSWFKKKGDRRITVATLAKQNLTLALIASLTAAVIKSPQTGFQRAAAFFQNCLTTDAQPENLNTVQDFLADQSMTLKDDPSFDPLDILAQFIFKFDIPLMLTLIPRPIQGSVNLVYSLEHPREFDDWVMFKPQTQKGSNYKIFVRGVVAPSGLPTGTVSDLDKTVEDIIKAEDLVIDISRAANSSVSDIHQLPLSQLGEWESSAQTGQSYPGQNWAQLVERHTNKKLPGTFDLVGSKSNLQFFHDLFGENSNITRKELQLYTYFATMLFFTNISGLLKPHGKSYCLTAVTAAFPNAAASAVLFATVNTTRIAEVKNMLALIVDQVRMSFEESKWLDTTTRSAAKMKISQTATYLGYARGLDTPRGVDDFLKDYPDCAGPFLGDVLKTREAAANKRITIVGSTSAKEYMGSFPAGPIHEMSSTYIDTLNYFYAAPASFYRPFFTYGGPSEVNYGALGRMLTSVMMKGFDDDGRAYDGSGGTANWWTSKSDQEYQTRRGCLANAVDDFQKYSKYYLDDVMGEGSVFRAYKAASINSTVTLGDVGGLTPDQIFYVSWCLPWCGVMGVDDAEPPADKRCNVPAMHSERFSTAFSCPAGSAMNPQQKCQFW